MISHPILRLSLATLACAWVSAVGAAVPNSDCLACHEKPAMDQKLAEPDPNAAIEVIQTASFTQSVHGKLQCVACHASIRDVPHDDKLPPAQCTPCHTGETLAYSRSIHGMSNAMGASAAATCTSCHGNAHEIIPVKQKESPVSMQNVPQTCAACHSNPQLIAAYLMNAHMAAKAESGLPRRP